VLTRMILRNFKLFDDVDIELGSPVVFIGPNNSGKTTALQALALWDIGVKRWSEKRGSSQAVKRPGVTINRRDLVAVPVPDANLLWRNLHVRDVQRDDSNRQQTENVRVEIIVEGVDSDFLDPLFEAFFQRLHLPDLMRKTNYHVLAGLLEPSEVDAEVIEVLDGIVETARAAAVGRASSSVTQTTTTRHVPPDGSALSGAVPPPGSGKG